MPENQLDSQIDTKLRLASQHLLANVQRKFHEWWHVHEDDLEAGIYAKYANDPAKAEAVLKEYVILRNKATHALRDVNGVIAKILED